MNTKKSVKILSILDLHYVNKSFSNFQFLSKFWKILTKISKLLTKIDTILTKISKIWSKISKDLDDN